MHELAAVAVGAVSRLASRVLVEAVQQVRQVYSICSRRGSWRLRPT